MQVRTTHFLPMSIFFLFVKMYIFKQITSIYSTSPNSTKGISVFFFAGKRWCTYMSYLAKIKEIHGNKKVENFRLSLSSFQIRKEVTLLYCVGFFSRFLVSFIFRFAKNVQKNLLPMKKFVWFGVFLNHPFLKKKTMYLCTFLDAIRKKRIGCYFPNIFHIRICNMKHRKFFRKKKQCAEMYFFF